MKLLSQIRLILTDLDETLLTDDRQVTPRTLTAIRHLEEQGVRVAICTGRALEATLPVAGRIGSQYIVCCNGALVRHGSQVLADETMPPEVTAELVHFFARSGAVYYLMTAEGFWVSEINEEVNRASVMRGFAPPLLQPGQEYAPAYKVMARGAAHLYDQVKAHFGHLVHIIYHPEYLEIAPFGIDKSWGARRLAEYLDLQQHQVLAFGDALNDVELLAWAGVGVAVANAMEPTRRAADFVTLSNNEEGVAEVLERVLRAREL
ncbi:MAG: Cof-type HAD-IIB family hydrolase [Bacillota bacterium]